MVERQADLITRWMLIGFIQGVMNTDNTSIAGEPIDSYDAWAVHWRRRLTEENADPDARCAAMQAANPAFIPRNHLVEAALNVAVMRQDFGSFQASEMDTPCDPAERCAPPTTRIERWPT